MTLPSEEKQSLYSAKIFLRDLLDPKKTPKIPKKIRRRALTILRHYPHNFEITYMFNLQETYERKQCNDDSFIDIRYGKGRR